mgnify:CR=1 FL=1
MVAYLACPYSHKDPRIQRKRLKQVNQTVHELLSQGIHVYSPLTHNVPINDLGFNGDWLKWSSFDHEMLSRCDRLIVLKLPGWEDSKGVKAEIEKAKELNLCIEWMEPLQLDVKDESLESLVDRLTHEFKEREWDKFHSPKNLAMNAAVELGELIEHFRWLTEEESYVKDPELLQKISDEIGDVFITLVTLADKLNIDPVKAAHGKLTQVCERYTIEKSKGSCKKIK